MSEADYKQWAADTALLAKIGRYLFPQDLRLRVRLPRELAERALAAWSREDIGDLPPNESPECRQVRHRAGSLGLIGLAVESSSLPEPGPDEVSLRLDAWEVGAALDAADDAGMLNDVRPPQR